MFLSISLCIFIPQLTDLCIYSEENLSAGVREVTMNLDANIIKWLKPSNELGLICWISWSSPKLSNIF